jgi:hypothetical protein
VLERKGVSTHWRNGTHGITVIRQMGGDLG